jgi:hypothetical protein
LRAVIDTFVGPCVLDVADGETILLGDLDNKTHATSVDFSLPSPTLFDSATAGSGTLQFADIEILDIHSERIFHGDLIPIFAELIDIFGDL